MLLGSSLFPKADTPQFLIDVQAPNGTSFEATERALRFVEARLAATPEVASYFSNLGHGNPQIYYNQIVRNDSSNFAEVFVLLKGYDPRRDAAAARRAARRLRSLSRRRTSTYASSPTACRSRRRSPCA